jgi:hypothetical protein
MDFRVNRLKMIRQLWQRHQIKGPSASPPRIVGSTVTLSLKHFGQVISGIFFQHDA